MGWSIFTWWWAFWTISIIIETVVLGELMSKVLEFLEVKFTISIVVTSLVSLFNKLNILWSNLMVILSSKIAESNLELLEVNFTTSIDVNHLEDLLELIFWTSSFTTIWAIWTSIFTNVVVLHELVGKVDELWEVKLVVTVPVSLFNSSCNPVSVLLGDSVADLISILKKTSLKFIVVNEAIVVGVKVLEDTFKFLFWSFFSFHLGKGVEVDC